MNKKCIFLKQKLNKTLYCKKYNKEINIKECSCCKYKKYDYNKALYKTPLKSYQNKPNKKNKPSDRTIALSIPKKVKLKVWERDNHLCIICMLYYSKITYVPWNYSNSHYIKRSHGGLGIEENIFTACLECHNKFDNTNKRKNILPIIKNYLISKYYYWNEDILIYKKHN